MARAERPPAPSHPQTKAARLATRLEAAAAQPADTGPVTTDPTFSRIPQRHLAAVLAAATFALLAVIPGGGPGDKPTKGEKPTSWSEKEVPGRRNNVGPEADHHAMLPTEDLHDYSNHAEALGPSRAGAPLGATPVTEQANLLGTMVAASLAAGPQTTQRWSGNHGLIL